MHSVVVGEILENTVVLIKTFQMKRNGWSTPPCVLVKPGSWGHPDEKQQSHSERWRQQQYEINTLWICVRSVWGWAHRKEDREEDDKCPVCSRSSPEVVNVGHAQCERPRTKTDRWSGRAALRLFTVFIFKSYILLPPWWFLSRQVQCKHKKSASGIKGGFVVVT